jgi:HlyD family secretion protein
MKKLFLVVLLLAVAAAVGWQFREKFRKSAEGLRLFGNVDIRGVDLGFRVGGRLLEVLKDEGDAVKAGELLAKIDRLPYEHELARAKAELAAAQADLDLKKSGYRSEEIDQARAQLEAARIVEKNAEKVRERQAGLMGGGGTSQQNLEAADATLEEVKQQMKVAAARLKQLESGFRIEEIAAATAKTAQAKAACDAAALRLQDTSLESSSDGIVLTRTLEPGAIVQPGATVMSLSLEHPVWVRAYVHEPDLGKFPPGTKVSLVTDGRPDRPFHGKVGFVSPRAEFTPKSVETPELRTSLVYRLRIVVDDTDGSLRQGMPVTVSLDPSPE